MQFGITLKPDISVERIVGLTKQAENAGFEYGWIFDSHVLWKEPFPLLTLMATNTQRMRLGTCVTNPATRDITVTASLFATLNLISGGRMELGIGRGDSSRRVLGKKPVSWSQLEAAVKELRDLMAGNEVEHDGQPARLTWAKDSPRIWIAGYGPKVLHMAGQVRSEEHTSELQSPCNLVCRLLLEKKKKYSFIDNPKKKKIKHTRKTE